MAVSIWERVGKFYFGAVGFEKKVELKFVCLLL
jgi:hypothetical protein